MSIFRRNSKSLAEQTQYYDLKGNLEATQKALDTAVYDLASANNHIDILKQQLRKKETAMTNTKPVTVSNNSQGNLLSIPIDLGNNYVVIIEGMPGRPSKAACERICKIVMSYAVDSQPTTSTPKTESEKSIAFDEDTLLHEISPSGKIVQTSSKIGQQGPETIIPAPLGSKATATVSKPVSPNPEV